VLCPRIGITNPPPWRLRAMNPHPFVREERTRGAKAGMLAHALVPIQLWHPDSNRKELGDSHGSGLVALSM